FFDHIRVSIHRFLHFFFDDANPDMVEKYLDGNDKVINAIFGRTMGLLRGQGDPGVVRKVLQEKLDALKDA
ncbi:MAG: GatB/YqeY domain-containing protein, partial [Chloroflexota bacterium]